MVEPLLGEIRMFGGSFAPENWAFCNGQLLSNYEYQALFSLLGTRYGGDGRTNFGLPDLRGRIVVSQGIANGSAHNYQLGEKSGEEQVTLLADNMPAHNHTINACDQNNTSGSANHGYFGSNVTQTAAINVYTDEGSQIVAMNDSVLAQSGQAVPITIMQPTLCINFILALQGEYPPRN